MRVIKRIRLHVAVISTVVAYGAAFYPCVAADRLSAPVAEVLVVPELAPAAPSASGVGQKPRPIALISDLHLGLGRRSDGTWSPKEDFRWSGALAGFLKEISSWGGDRVDLVIVGDFLELWQPPSGIDCVGQGADLGCTISEMVRIVEFVVAAHRDDLALIRDFARRGDNRLIVIPGNHDSSLFLPQVWAPVAAALGAESGRIVLAAAGLWSSADGRIVAEHGHQIGSDVNRYLSWPRITRESQRTTYIERPWGERFVQRIFNDQEEEYEIIDNISPETVGLKYRIADRGFPKTAADLAKFIAFNLFETSVTQKLRSLGRDSPSAVESGLIEWNVKWARDELDYRLIAEALPKDDPLRAAIKGTDTEADGLKAELSSLVKDPTRLADDDVRALCSQLSTMDGPRCDILTAGAAIEVNFFPRQFVLRNHISGRIESHQRMSIFVYGHTHQFEEGWILSVSSVSSVKVHNTGAFQRTVDESGFLSRIQKRNLAPAEALRAIKLEELAPCYGVVLITYDQSGVPLSDTRLWHMPEGGVGSMVNPGDHRCQ